ncbi:MAG: NAD(P)H-dependent oxidoreductase [Gammaproteobacteria bacterium]|jgi:NAD(P)H dehydrogenase (quinone)|nr:NAD(P)H-dependent oxidoreductase [Gammaproteobacteria bacterium]MBT3725374.1 NAD(P)H-dependent oxidoreductase [Gammaproteobacteria bacterium]MBT4078607.1 NAD(P)H-dependent oxidoreductase [Gammaproteobacteria bacterium]MBT4193688.1 NAD(P)H-dependent oxidoreductase [Gammaproteobacteria bacterium]MBT4451010.1 NAD(P)H-dependent oxidoreductase [Gammaproteobacteria bacterium]
MKHLIIYTHLNPNSFAKAVADEVESAAAGKGHEIKSIDLYAEKFNPILEFPDIQYSFMNGDAPEDVKAYQQQISWADQITFIYPLWWGHMPAMLKGFIDRVFSNGFAYTYDENGPKGLLEGKSVHQFINTGNPSEVLSENGMHDAIRKEQEGGIFGFCGMKAETTFFGNIIMSTEQDRKDYLNSIKAIV